MAHTDYDINKRLNREYGSMDLQLPEFSGQRLWVDSNGTDRGDDSSHGMTPDKPFATAEYAVSRCRSAAANNANTGVQIILMENHAEDLTAADALALDVAGLTLWGLGTGSNRPTFTFTTATAAEIDVSAADVHIHNIIGVCNIASQVAMINVAAGGDGLKVTDCEFREGSATGVSFIVLGDADDVVIDNCRFFAPTAGNYDEAIHINAALDRLQITNCTIRGDFDDAGIHNPTSNVATNILIADNVVENLQSGDHAIELVSACTGYLVNNKLNGDTLGTILDPGSCRCHDNTESAAIDTPGVPSPLTVTDSAANILGADNSNNAFASTNVVRNADGSIIERLESIEASLAGAAGVATYPAAAAAANAVSVAEVVRYISELQVPRTVVKESGSMASGYGTGDSPVTLFTVTGDVLVKACASVDVNCTSTSNNGTLELGVAGNTASLLVQDVVDGTAFQAGDDWTLISAADNPGAQLADEWLLVGDGEDIILTIATNNMTAGEIDFYVVYIPLTASSSIVAA